MRTLGAFTTSFPYVIGTLGLHSLYRNVKFLQQLDFFGALCQKML